MIFGCPWRPPAPCPIPTHPPGTGCLATLADWVSRVKKGSGTGRRNQITPIDHLLPALLRELGPRPQNQSPAIMSERRLLPTQGSWERHGRLCVVARSDTPYHTSQRDAATSQKRCDCNWRPALERARSGERGCTDKPSMSRKGPALCGDLLSDIMRYGGIYLRSLAVIWIDTWAKKKKKKGTGWRAIGWVVVFQMPAAAPTVWESPGVSTGGKHTGLMDHIPSSNTSVHCCTYCIFKGRVCFIYRIWYA